MSDALISQESARIVEEVRNFLGSTVVDLTISNEVEKKNAVTLGNGLQKKRKIIEELRKKEKSVYDAKCKAVQDEFKPTLNMFDEKINILSTSITKYDRALEIERQKRQQALEDAAQKEREALEKFAGKREERLKLYQDKREEANEKLRAVGNDTTAATVIIRQIRYFDLKIQEFTEKVSATTMAAASVVTPIYQHEQPTANSGTRKTMKSSYYMVDFKKFVLWCLANDELQFIEEVEVKLKQRIKEKEGRLEIDGMECSYLEETSFSGR
jgi:hypothetical protein